MSGVRNNFSDKNLNITKFTKCTKFCDTMFCIQESWFVQNLDHFRPTDGRTWKQRYWIRLDYYRYKLHYTVLFTTEKRVIKIKCQMSSFFYWLFCMWRASQHFLKFAYSSHLYHSCRGTPGKMYKIINQTLICVTVND